MYAILFDSCLYDFILSTSFLLTMNPTPHPHYSPRIQHGIAYFPTPASLLSHPFPSSSFRQSNYVLLKVFQFVYIRSVVLNILTLYVPIYYVRFFFFKFFDFIKFLLPPESVEQTSVEVRDFWL